MDFGVPVGFLLCQPEKSTINIVHTPMSTLLQMNVELKEASLLSISNLLLGNGPPCCVSCKLSGEHLFHSFEPVSAGVQRLSPGNLQQNSPPFLG